jgi:hypothetical protein
MSEPTLVRQRLAALFLAGLLLWFSPLVLQLERAGVWNGLPLLYIYLFAVWILLIGLAAWLVSRDRD